MHRLLGSESRVRQDWAREFGSPTDCKLDEGKEESFSCIFVFFFRETIYLILFCTRETLLYVFSFILFHIFVFDIRENHLAHT